MVKIRVGKSRKITGPARGLETWIKCELEKDYAEDPHVNDVKDLLTDVEYILECEEADEREYWKATESKTKGE